MRIAKTIGSLLKDSTQAWSKDRASRLAAALAYYALFSLAPLLIIAIAIAGYFVGPTEVQEQILSQVQDIIGPDVAQIIASMLSNISRPGSGTLAAGIGVITLIWAASNLFGQLQLALNTVWGVNPEATSGVTRFVIRRLVAVLMVIGVGVLLLVSLLAVTLVSTLNTILVDIIPGVVEAMPFIDPAFSLGLMVITFSIAYQVLPDKDLRLSDVLPGALLTACLFVAGKILIGFYLSNAGFRSTYGAAGSLVALLVWIYYSAQIFLFGAEFTKVYTHRYGSKRTTGRRIPAIEAVVAHTGEAAWPALAYTGAHTPASRSHGRRDAADPDAEPSRWLLPAFLAFVAGIVVGARRRPPPPDRAP